MAYERKIPLLECGHEYIRKVLLGRWKVILLLCIEAGTNRPGEIARVIHEASRRVLEAQLAELVKHEIVSKTVYEGAVPHVEYALTDLGHSLMPVIMAMQKWGNDNIERLKRTVN